MFWCSDIRLVLQVSPIPEMMRQIAANEKGPPLRSFFLQTGRSVLAKLVFWSQRRVDEWWLMYISRWYWYMLLCDTQIEINNIIYSTIQTPDWNLLRPFAVEQEIDKKKKSCPFFKTEKLRTPKTFVETCELYCTSTVFVFGVLLRVLFQGVVLSTAETGPRPPFLPADFQPWTPWPSDKKPLKRLRA